MSCIELPWPSASLSGHAKGHWRTKATATKKHRAWAHTATVAWAVDHWRSFNDHDIRIKITFVPPTKRGDRTNFPNRIKPYLDGIASALGVNDARFLPSYVFCEPEAPGCVRFTLEAA